MIVHPFRARGCALAISCAALALAGCGGGSPGAGATRSTVATVPFDGTSVHLKVSFDGHENASFFFSNDGCTWHAVGAPISVGLDAEADLSWRLQAWSGAAIGLHAVKRGATSDNHADFDSFTVTDLD